MECRGLAMVVLFSTAGGVAGQTCDNQKDITFIVDASAVSRLSLDLGAGHLEITGDPSRDEIFVVARACGASRDVVDGIDLVHERQDDLILIHSEMRPPPPRPRSRFRPARRARLHVKMYVPADIHLRIDDEGGDVDVSGVAGVDVTDGAGAITLFDIQGDVEVEDRSGDIEVDRIGGRVTIRDQSGHLRIENVGAVDIVNDQSGHIRIENVLGDVVIRRDGSGHIVIQGVDGRVSVAYDGSGDIEITAVRGGLVIGETGAGDLRIHDVSGPISFGGN